MKKLFFAVAVLGLVSLASCSKEKDCVCTQTMTGFDDVVTNVTIEDGDCDEMNTEVTTLGITTKLECVEE